MPTRKGIFKSIGNRVSSALNARPEAAAKFATRGLANIARGTALVAGGTAKLKEGDVRGAVRDYHSAANKVIGKKNITAAAHATIGKKASEKISKGVRVVNRLDRAQMQASSGDLMGAIKTAAGKKMTTRVKTGAKNVAMKAANRVTGGRATTIRKRAKKAREKAKAIRAIMNA